MSSRPAVEYDFAVLRAVPRVHVGTFTNVGVVVHVRTAELLVARALTDVVLLRERVPGVDLELLVRYLRAWEATGAGDPSAGPVALSSSAERFHWLTAPRSDVLQSSPVHEGVCADPYVVLDELFAEYVLGATGC